MKDVLIERYCFSQEHGTFGYLTGAKDLGPDAAGPAVIKLHTVEEVWRSNAPGSESCIPEGTYDLILDFYYAGNYTAYLVVNPALGVTADRRILIHAGNTILNSKACILPGMYTGFMNGKWAVVESRTALDAFMSFMDKDIGRLTIRNLRPEYRWPPT